MRGQDLLAAGVLCCFSSFNPRAPRGARLRPSRRATRPKCFNPRAPRGARHLSFRPEDSSLEFQSTRPAWGATSKRRGIGGESHVSIHAPRVGRDDPGRCTRPPFGVSIHAPRVGRDQPNGIRGNQPPEFQSTRPAWGATIMRLGRLRGITVSIHAPRVGRDPERRLSQLTKIRFQSTRPAWGATGPV